MKKIYDMTTKQVTIIRKSRHIEWDVNLGIVGAKRLTSPLFADCIELSETISQPKGVDAKT